MELRLRPRGSAKCRHDSRHLVSPPSLPPSFFLRQTLVSSTKTKTSLKRKTKTNRRTRHDIGAPLLQAMGRHSGASINRLEDKLPLTEAVTFLFELFAHNGEFKPITGLGTYCLDEAGSRSESQRHSTTARAHFVHWKFRGSSRFAAACLGETARQSQARV